MRAKASPAFCATRRCECWIVRISSPCFVSNPVRMTIPIATSGRPALLAAELPPSLPDESAPEPPADAERICVPPKTIWCPWSRGHSGSAIAFAVDIETGGSPSFICGVDSPVSMASLTTADPRTRTMSAGTTHCCDPVNVRWTTSNGNRSRQLTVTTFPFLRTSTGNGGQLPMSFMLCMERRRCMTWMHSSIVIMKPLNTAKSQYSSRTSSRTQKIWNT